MLDTHCTRKLLYNEVNPRVNHGSQIFVARRISHIENLAQNSYLDLVLRDHSENSSKDEF